MKYFYDNESDSLYLTLAEGRKYRDSVQAAPGVVLDFDPAGRLIGVDLEHASKTIDIESLELGAEPTRADLQVARMDGVRLKSAREALGMTQVQLGSRLSVSPNTVARWERGEVKIEHSGMLHLALRALGNPPASGLNARQRVGGRIIKAGAPVVRRVPDAVRRKAPAKQKGAPVK